MAERKTKNKKQNKKSEYNASNQNTAARVLFIIFAVLIILSMVLSTAITY
jgi:uncharacterized membrane protein